MANSSVGMALLIVLAIDGILLLGQVAVQNINPESHLVFAADLFIGNYKSAGNYTLNQADPLSKMPSGNPVIQPGDGNFFTDTFAAGWNWFADTTGLSYLFGVLGGPYNYVSTLGLPLEFTFVVGAIWYGLTLFLLVAFLLGRN